MLNYFFKSSLNIYYETPTCLFLKIQETQTYVTKQVKDLIPQSHCSEIIIFNKRCVVFHIYTYAIVLNVVWRNTCSRRACTNLEKKRIEKKLTI